METIENRQRKREELLFVIYWKGGARREDIWPELSYTQAEGEKLLQGLINHNDIFWAAGEGFKTSKSIPLELFCEGCDDQLLWHQNEKTLFCPICDDY